MPTIGGSARRTRETGRVAATTVVPLEETASGELGERIELDNDRLTATHHQYISNDSAAYLEIGNDARSHRRCVALRREDKVDCTAGTGGRSASVQPCRTGPEGS